MFPVIIAAAIKYGDLVCHVPRPGRHHNVLHALAKLRSGSASRSDWSFQIEQQGFLTDEGEFLDRRSAFLLAKGNSQMKTRLPGQYDGDELFSEDLW